MKPHEREDILEPVTVRASCKAIVEPIALAADLEAVGLLTASCANPVILETLQPARIAGRYSIFAADPVEILTVNSVEDEPLERLYRRAAQYPMLGPVPCELPFAGGWIGHMSYEAGVPPHLVDVRASAPETPLLRFGLYDYALLFDHHLERWWATAIDWENGLPQRPTAAERLHALRNRLVQAGRLNLSMVACPQRRVAYEELARADYNSRVERIREYIKAGDIYQANLAQRFRIDTDEAPFELYRRVRSENPSSYAAYLAWDDRAILSASPELFLELRGDHVVTRPIKGTRPRLGDVAVDSVRCADLESSEKEHSELNMIIDLLRNDLGRVCEFGSVRVSDAGTTEDHPTVFHRVATVEGRLADGKNWSDLLRAAFPGGSIVGAPKLRAMQIIRELEPFARGAYCGAIGWIGLDGNMTLNIAIRTMIWQGGKVNAFAGGAIVAESEADAEYEEILAKAAGMLSSLNAGISTEKPRPKPRILVARE